MSLCEGEADGFQRLLSTCFWHEIFAAISKTKTWWQVILPNVFRLENDFRLKWGAPNFPHLTDTCLAYKLSPYHHLCLCFAYCLTLKT